MFAKKIISLIVITLIFTTCLIITRADFPPQPGDPHSFWGTIKNQKGENISDGTIIKAIVDNEIYYTTVISGIYGFNETYHPSNPPFFVEDPNDDNEGKTIYFYVGNINTTQIAIYEKNGETQLNLVVSSASQDDDNGQSNNDNNANPQNKNRPTANINGPYFGTVNRSISFDGSKSNDSDGTILSYIWDFGDESMGQGVSPTHNYTQVGSYTLILTVTDNDGLSDNDTTIVSITDDSDNDGWSDDEENRYNTNPYNANDYPLDTDSDYIPDIVDPDDDNDGFSDVVENTLGTNSLNPNDPIKIIYEGIIFYFIDINGDGYPDKYFNKTTGLNTTLQESSEKDKFYVDVNNDGKPDYVYDSFKSTIILYSNKDQQNLSYLMFILFIIILIILGSLFLIIYRKKHGGKKK